jgi:hypothetical protein
MHYPRTLILAGTSLLLLCSSVFAAGQMLVSSNKSQPDSRRPRVDSDAFIGDFQGAIRGSDGTESPIVGQVIAQGGDTYKAVLLAAFDQRVAPIAVLTGKVQGTAVSFGSGVSLEGNRFHGKLTGRISGDLDMSRIERRSPSLGAKPPKDAISLFDGTNADQWVGLDKSKAREVPLGWKIVQNDMLEVVPGSGWAKTRQRFRNVRLHLEFRIPLVPNARGQARGNSGVHLQGRYEIQILDSYGLEGLDNECGALYKVAPPRVNMCAPPLQWQTYDIVFYSARYDQQGRKIVGPRISVVHNGMAIHKDVEIPGRTANAPIAEDADPGPIILQDHGSPVQFRNIWLVELPDNPARG